MNLENIKEKIMDMLPQKRFNHSLNVAKCAVKLSEIYDCDKDKAYIAAITHDCAKYLNYEEIDYYINKYEIYLDELENNNIALSHSVIGSYIAQYELGIEDKDIISAIKYHTTGKDDMTLLEKIIYLADTIEEDRNFKGVDLLRELAYGGNIDEALLISFNNSIKFVIDNNQMIHPRTIKARNYMLNQMNSKNR